MVDNARYYVDDTEEGVCERLPMDSKLARRVMRGTSGNSNAYVSPRQATALAKYVPTTKWAKDERIVYIIMQDILDRTGNAPTATQISEISKTRDSASLVDAQELPEQGLSVKRVERALRNLQKRGIVLGVG